MCDDVKLIRCWYCSGSRYVKVRVTAALAEDWAPWVLFLIRCHFRLSSLYVRRVEPG